MTKILIVSDYLDKIWWIESYIHDLKKILERDWFIVDFFWWQNITKTKKILWLIKSFNNTSESKKFRQKLEEFKPDLIWFHSVSRYLGPAVVAEWVKFPAKTIMIYHDLGYFAPFADKVFNESDIPEKFNLIEFLKKNPKNFLYYPYIIFKFLKLKRLRQQLQKVDFHTTPSKFMKKYVIKHWYWKEENTQVLPNFILKEKIWTRKDILQDKINFIFFGRLDPEKGIWQIIYFLSEIWNLKYTDKQKFKEITSKIRILIFWDGKKKKDLLETFTGKNIYWEDIWIVADLSNLTDLTDFTNNPELVSESNKFVYYFWKRDFETIKEFLGFSHFNLVPSLFLETFGLSAAEACANQVVNIGFDKTNINSFILDKYKIQPLNYSENFAKKMFEIIENFDKTNWEKDSKESFELVKDFII